MVNTQLEADMCKCCSDHKKTKKKELYDLLRDRTQNHHHDHDHDHHHDHDHDHGHDHSHGHDHHHSHEDSGAKKEAHQK